LNQRSDQKSGKSELSNQHFATMKTDQGVGAVIEETDETIGAGATGATEETTEGQT